MIVVPEITILNVLNAILRTIKNDWNKDIDKTKSMLYYILNGQKSEGCDYYEQAIDLFLRDDSHSRKIKTNIAFNMVKSSVPTIHITLPGEQTENNGLSIDEGYEEDIQTDHESNPVYTRMFGCRCDLLITSDNSTEVLLIYHVLRASLISFFNQLEFSGIRNVKFSGQEIRLQSEMTPNLSARGMGLAFNYEVSVPSFFEMKDIISEVTFTGKITKDE